MNCVKCGGEAGAYHFRVLQVQTLHIRDFGKNQRIQALGDFEEYEVCGACAEKKLQDGMNDKAAIRKACILWGAMIAMGMILTAVFWNGEGVLRLLGVCGMACGALCMYSGVKTATAKRRELQGLDRETALYRCAWECLLDGAPQKYDVNDLTYIPVDEETLGRKNGDLMILYDLLPEIAVEAYKRIHGQQTTAE